MPVRVPLSSVPILATFVAGIGGVSLPAVAAPELDARVGVLETRLPGMPTTSVAARRIVSAEVRQDLLKERLSATIVLAGTPTAATSAAVAVQFGRDAGDGCRGTSASMWVTASSAVPDRGFTRKGRTLSFDLATDDADGNWNCAIAALVGDDPPAMFDGLQGPLKPVHAAPQLRLGKVTLLGEAARPLALVPGVWTTLEVPIVNDGRGDARKVVLRGSGKGVRVRQVRVGTVSADGETTERVQVMLTGKRAAQLTLTAVAGAARGSTKIGLKPMAAPPRPVDGRWASSDGKITFRVKAGKVTEWRGANLALWCYPPFGTPSYQPISVVFKTTPVAKSGIVDATETWRDGSAWYNAWLSMRLSGSTATQGEYSYVTEGFCRVSADFKARWVGR